MTVKSFTISGAVISGDGYAGSVLGIPTANLNVTPVGLEFGVYAARVVLKNNTYDAAVCYGALDAPKFEAHIFDFEGDILGETLIVEIVEQVSELITWQSHERMRQKILHDLELVREVLKN
ncbi:MAG: riboflavin kinase [Patescibacteria group bacterium]